MPKVYNRHHKNAPPDAVYVGRPSCWGNPFVMGKDGTREEVVAKYRRYIEGWSGILPFLIQELRGKDLICCCAPKACHADVLLEIANKEIK